MSTTTRTENFEGLAICCSLKSGAVKLHRATCSAVVPSRSMYVFTALQDVIDGVVSGGENGQKVTRCACCKVAA